MSEYLLRFNVVDDGVDSSVPIRVAPVLKFCLVVSCLLFITAD
jgi:hypothetical protein